MSIYLVRHLDYIKIIFSITAADHQDSSMKISTNTVHEIEPGGRRTDTGISNHTRFLVTAP